MDLESAPRVSTFGFFAYSHFVGSPAFRLANAPGTGLIVWYLRRLAKNHRRSRLIGPPPAPLTSHELLTPAGWLMPKLMSVSFRLLPVDHFPASLKKPDPLKVLPPDLGTRFTCGPPFSASASAPETCTCISSLFAVS